MTKFDKFLGNLKSQTENLILVTLKHMDGLHNQKRHGWRYGANLLMPNGIGKPTIERAQAYLKKVMSRDLQTRVSYNKGTKTGRSNVRNKIENTHMEFQRRTRTGTRRAGITKDPQYGRNLGDIDRKAGYMKITRGTKREQLRTLVPDRWASRSPQLKDPLGGRGDSNRVNPKTGRANPRKNDAPLAERRLDGRDQLKVYRRGKMVKKTDARRVDTPLKGKQVYMRTYGRANPSADVSSSTNYPGAKGSGGPPKKRGSRGQFSPPTATKELRNHILATLEEMFYIKTNG